MLALLQQNVDTRGNNNVTSRMLCAMTIWTIIIKFKNRPGLVCEDQSMQPRKKSSPRNGAILPEA